MYIYILYIPCRINSIESETLVRLAASVPIVGLWRTRLRTQLRGLRLRDHLESEMKLNGEVQPDEKPFPAW